jgi:hypothetical protein
MILLFYIDRVDMKILPELTIEAELKQWRLFFIYAAVSLVTAGSRPYWPMISLHSGI